MRTDFWLERWQRNEIGFHQKAVNQSLRQYLALLALREGQEIFVPLCGKSRDIVWLTQQGLKVAGIELSPIAVNAFFEENGLRPTQVDHDALECWQTSGVRLFRGDFFELSPADLANSAAVYDRAALIALPPEMRPRYAERMATLLHGGRPMLVVTLEYPDGEMQGPPFSVPEADVRAYYGEQYDVRLLGSRDVLEASAHLKERGVTRLEEKSYLLLPKAG